MGLGGGTYVTGNGAGGAYRDSGFGLTLRYRAAESLGIEAGWQFHQDSWETVSTRTTQPASLSFQVFAFPWAVLSPYALAGVTVTRQIDHSVYWATLPVPDGDTSRIYAGPHAGLGLELSVGFQTAISVEARSIRYIAPITGSPDDGRAFQSRVMLNVYF